MIEISPRLWPSRQAFALKNLESWNVHLLILPQKSLEEHNKRLSICSVYHQHHIQWFVAYNNKRPQSFCGALSLIFRRNVHCLIKTKEIIGTRNQVLGICNNYLCSEVVVILSIINFFFYNDWNVNGLVSESGIFFYTNISSKHKVFHNKLHLFFNTCFIYLYLSWSNYI